MQFSIRIDPTSGQRYFAVPLKGEPLLLHPMTNKGTAFTNRERSDLDLHGLLPPAVLTIRQQLDRTYENYLTHPTDLDKFVYLSGLHDRNEILFYRLVHEHIDEMMPIVYTPVVGEACQKFSHIYRKPRGVYISFEQRGYIEKILTNSGIDNPSIIVVTDGERILGLGDQGVGGMGIPIGKLCLYTLCAGVSPYSTLPIMLDVGTNNEDRLKDPLYFGMRHERLRGDAYQEFIDRFVVAVKKVFPHVVLQWEDFFKGNAIKQLNRFRDELCTFNDDIQGTAGVVLAGLFSALRITKQPMKNQRVVFAGAGAAAQGIADLIVTALMEEGLSREQAMARIWTVDRKGLVTKARSGIEDFKATYAREIDEAAYYQVRDRTHITLEETVQNVKPTILIGTSGSTWSFRRRRDQSHGQGQSIPYHPPAFQSDLEVRVSPGERHSMVWRTGHHGYRKPVPARSLQRHAISHRSGQQRFRFPGNWFGFDRITSKTGHRHYVSESRQGVGCPGH